MSFFNFFKREDTMSEQENCGRCHNKVNLCNDSLLQFGRTGCTYGADEVITPSINNTRAGYAVNEGKINELKISWLGEADEEIVVFVNGKEVVATHIEGLDGTECVKLKEKICDCDVITVMERKDEEGKGILACDITVVVVLELACDHRFIREGDGVIEAIDTTGTTAVNAGNVWFTRTLDTVRNNTLPAYMGFLDTEDAIVLKEGIYKIWYESGISFDQSIAIDYSVKLQENINGGGWIDVVQSGAKDYTLAGNDGNVSAGRMITYRVNRGDIVKIRIQEMINKDTSLESGSAGAGIVVERIARSIDL